MTQILVTGGSGFVGSNLARFFSARKSVTITYFHSNRPRLSEAIKSVQLDISDAKEVFSVFENISPQVVIHAAGNKNVKDCEAHPDYAYQTNAVGTLNVARACRLIGARLIYISTDLVFSGIEGGYKETDIPQPTLIYGKTKLQGEEFALRELNDVAICRSAGIYGKGSPLLGWLSSQLNAGQVVEGFTDVVNTPTYAYNLGEMVEVILAKELTGIFHTVGRQRLSRYQFFQAYAKAFALRSDLLLPVTGGEGRLRMLLQADASLSSEQTSAMLGINFNSVDKGFERLKQAGGI